MNGITVETLVSGEAELRELFRSAESTFRDRIRKVLADVGQQVQDAARAAAPVRTGALQRSIRWKPRETVEEMSISVAPAKYYARFVEFGTVNHQTLRNAAPKGSKLGKVSRVRALRQGGMYRVAPRPFMGPASDSVRGKVQGMLDAATAAAIADAQR